MKLLMISTDRKMFEKGSAVALRQIEYAKNYEEVHIIVFASKDFSETTLGSNVWLYPTRSGSRWKYVFDAVRLGRFILEKRGITDITCQDPFETGLVGMLLKKRSASSSHSGQTGLRLELQIHTDIGSPYFQKFTFLNRIRTLISKSTLPKADNIRVVSERIRMYVSGYADASKITIRPITPDIEKIKATPITTDLHKKYPQFSKIILMVSRLEPEKNIGMALEAFKTVLYKMPQAGLVIVGSGNEEGVLKKLVQSLGIEKSVVFEGWQSEVISYYKTCDLFLNTSWYEGYGMTLVEAKASGCKIVTTDVGVAREVEVEIVDFNHESISHGIIVTL